MKNIENRNSYFNYFKIQTDKFDLNKFMFSKDIVVDNGAIILISPYQMILTMNIPKNNGLPGSGSHDETNEILTSLLYDLPIIDSMHKFSLESKMNFYIRSEQNILIRMINEGNSLIHMRGINIELPKTVTSSQLELLIYLEKEYGELLTIISKQMLSNGESPLILFKKNNGEDVFCNSFKEVIQYIKDDIVDDKKEIIKENYIIGITHDDIKIKKERW